MGAGIAHAFLANHCSVTVIELDEGASAAARDRVLRSLLSAEERHALPAPITEISERLTVTSTTSALARCDLIIEAVPEEEELKLVVLRDIEKQAAPQAVIATNTSSLSVGRLASALERPERFLGMHFFNPVPVSRLIEIVVGTSTSSALVKTVKGWVETLGKTPIVVSDTPGLATSRLGVVLALEAIRMLEAGVATAEDIDAAMVLGYSHRMGPLRTTDVVGLDVRLAIAEYLSAQLGDRFRPPELLRRMVAEGHTGRKAGRGFFTW